MQQNELKARVLRFMREQRRMILKKNGDYANADALSNFKLAGNVTGLNARLNVLSLIGTKVARLGVLLNSGKTPNNESILDSVLDLANYSVLLNCIIEEEEGNNFVWHSDGAMAIEEERYLQCLKYSRTNDYYKYREGQLGMMAVFCLTKDDNYYPSDWNATLKNKIKAINDPQKLLAMSGAFSAAEWDRLEKCKDNAPN